MNASIVANEDSLNNEDENGTLLVVDGHSLAFRAFYAISADNFSTKSGFATNAIWGFSTMLSQVIEKEKPDKLAVAFDVKGGTFRNKLLPQYKGTREAAPEELLAQLPVIQELLNALGVKYITKQGYEGDDIIATLATMGAKARYKTLVLSGDRDAFQLIDEYINVLYPGRHFKDLKQMDTDAIIEKYNVTPKQYSDLAALRGETSDNIPGVPGVGDGYAAKWINQFGGLEGIIEHADQVTGKKGESLRESIDQIRLNKKVNTLVKDLDLGVSINDLEFGNVDAASVGELFERLEFGTRSRRKILKEFTRGSKELLEENIKMMISAGSTHAVSDVNSTESDNSDDLEDFKTIVDKINIHKIYSESDLDNWINLVSPCIEKSESKGSSELVKENTEYKSKATVDLFELLDSQEKPSLNLIRNDLECAKTIKDHKELVIYALQKPNNSSQFGIYADVLVMLSQNNAAIVYSDVLNGDSSEDCNKICHKLKDFIKMYESSIVLHDYKKHIALLKSLKIVDNNYSFNPLLDTRLASYLIEPDFRNENIEDMAEHVLNIHVENEKSNEEPAQGELDFVLEDSDNPEELNQEEDKRKKQEKRILETAVTIRLLAKQYAIKLDERKQTGLMVDVEMPVSRVLRGMEDAGAAVDMNRLVSMRDNFAAEAQFAQKMALDVANKPINLQSPKQLQQLLFEDMGLKPTRRTKSGSYTTNAEALQELYAKIDPDEKASQFLGALLKHRETNKLKQIVQSLIDSARYEDGRIHTTFEQTIAATGRLSSSDPNLQNIPNRNVVGREIRAAFIPGNQYDQLMSCDYSQVELRIMAHASADETLIKAFKSGVDFHKFVASLVYKIPVEQVSPDQRSHVKAMSYGLAYGLSTYGLAKQLSISPAAAEVLKEKYFDTFGGVHDYLESLVDKARKLGYTQTMFGRRRYFPKLNSTNRASRESAERAALNAPIQGSAADIMKLAMIQVDKDLREAKVKSRVILQIHDELVLEIAHGEADIVENIVKNAMEHTVELDVPLNVSTGLGADWQLAAH